MTDGAPPDPWSVDLTAIPVARPDFLEQSARTKGLRLGVPRSFCVSPDGSRVAFLRTRAGDDPVSCLWVLDLPAGTERLVADPRDLGEPERGGLTDAERARRERARERASGIVAYATDDEVRVASFAVGGRLFVADLATGDLSDTGVEGVDDPRPDPTGAWIAIVKDGGLSVLERSSGTAGTARELARDPDPDVTWGLPEFIAAEEMGRMRGHWWAPDGTRIAATRVDERPVRVLHIFDPTDPEAPPRAVRYPRAGTDNAIVTLHVIDRETGRRVQVEWDRDAFEYLARVEWSEPGLTVQVQSRDQRRTQVLDVDPATGSTRVVREDVDPDWIELVEGVPARLDDGRLVVTADADDTRRLVIDGELATPPGLQVRRIVGAESDVVFTASEEPTETHVWRVTPGAQPERITVEPGVHTAARSGVVLVVQSRTESDPLPTTRVLRGSDEVAAIAAVAQAPVIDPRPWFAVVGKRQLRTALLLPGGRAPEEVPADSSLPVLLDPYAGPHFQRVTRTKLGFVESQWFAEQGFAVLVADGRGTPGRGPAWEREIAGSFLVTLDDQVDALHAAAELYGFLDLTRVAIRGWSFGGELAAAAALRRPDVFHAAISGAPVTVQDLYDTHYTERYLGHPADQPESYRRSSLVGDAPALRRPLLLIHGTADDNVVVAHSLRLSAALFEAGRRHELILLPDLTHMAGSDAAERNLPLVELDFLRRSLGLDAG